RHLVAEAVRLHLRLAGQGVFGGLYEDVVVRRHRRIPPRGDVVGDHVGDHLAVRGVVREGGVPVVGRLNLPAVGPPGLNPALLGERVQSGVVGRLLEDLDVGDEGLLLDPLAVPFGGPAGRRGDTHRAPPHLHVIVRVVSREVGWWWHWSGSLGGRNVCAPSTALRENYRGGCRRVSWRDLRAFRRFLRASGTALSCH